MQVIKLKHLVSFVLILKRRSKTWLMTLSLLKRCATTTCMCTHTEDAQPITEPPEGGRYLGSPGLNSVSLMMGSSIPNVKMSKLIC